MNGFMEAYHIMIMSGWEYELKRKAEQKNCRKLKITLAIGILIWAYMKQRNTNDIYIDSDDE